MNERGMDLLFGGAASLRPCLSFADNISSTPFLPPSKPQKKVWIIQLKFLG